VIWSDACVALTEGSWLTTVEAIPPDTAVAPASDRRFGKTRNAQEAVA
jgi:hypothetical protein